VNVLGIDIETASCADLKTVGAWRYSLHPSTRVWCVVLGWISPVGKPELIQWEPGQKVPFQWLASFAKQGMSLLAHNCSFEKAILANVLSKQGWAVPPLSAWQDTQAHAAAANLPITLEGLGKALGAPVQKDTEGHDLMKKMCWLDPVMEQGELVYRNKHDTPENRARLLRYCETDVVSMLECWKRVPKMHPREAVVWQLDQKINARGVYIDRDLVARMGRMLEKRRNQLAGEAIDDSDGALMNSTGTPALKKWLKAKNIELPMQKRVGVSGEHESENAGRQVILELAAAVETDEAVRRVLLNRLEATKATSLAKLDKVERMVDPRDGRLRNSLHYCGAHTGRWAGRGFQLHNMPRPKKGDTPEEKERLRRIRDAVLTGDLELLEELCDATA
jgi:DNA polymerase